MNGDETLVFNGINGETGEYLFTPMTPEDITESAKKKESDEEKQNLASLQMRQEREDEGH